MVKRLILVITAVVLGSNLVLAQDPEFTQFYANRLYLNPAFAGEVKCPRIALNYRNQWPHLGSTYVTYSFSGDMYVRQIQGGVGLNIYRDVQGHGAITTTNVSMMYAYTLNVNRKFSVKAGFEASYFQKRLAWDFVFPEMIHPLYGVIFTNNETSLQEVKNLNVNHFDFSAGMIGFSDDYYFGIAVHHLTQPPETHRDNFDAQLPRKYTVHFGTNIPIVGRTLKKGELFISPNVLFQQQQDFQQLNYGIYANRNSIVIGLWLRQNFNFHYDSFIMMLGYSAKKLKFAYSYDLTVSKLKNHNTLGAHEVSYIMIFNCKEPKTKFRTISCPSF